MYKNTLVIALVLSGCKVTDAPDTLEAMMVYGFVNVGNADESQAVADELPAMVKRHLDDLESGYRVDSLGKKKLTEAGVDPGEMEDPIVGAMGRITYLSNLDDVIDAVSHKHRDQIAENTTEFEVLEETDRGCFLKRDCETYQVQARQVTKQAVIGNVTQTFTQDFMWVTVDDQDAVISRVLAPDPVEVSSNLAAVEQQYSFWLIRELPKGGCERVEAMWAEARLLGGDLPDTFLVDSAVNAMGKQAEKVDHWIDTGEAS